MSEWGLGGPKYIAFATESGIKIVSANSTVTDVMTEPWILCWFNGGTGWTTAAGCFGNKMDAPVLLVLQKKPSEIKLDATGLTLTYAQPRSPGTIAMMNLFGYSRLPQNYVNTSKPGVPSFTDNWQNGIPGGVAGRCRFFTRLLRRYPVYCKEEFAIEGEDLIIRYSYEWYTIDDEWNTPALRLAPLPPNLALAWWLGANTAHGSFPMTFTHSVKDAGIFTSYGPYAGVLDTDSFSVRMAVMKYIYQIEVPQTPDAAYNTVLTNLENRMKGAFYDGTTFNYDRMWNNGGAGNYCWDIMGQRWFAKALPYLSRIPSYRDVGKATIRNYLQNFVLDPSKYRVHSPDNMLLLVGPGVGVWDAGYDDAGKFSSNLLETIWDFAYYADAFDIVQSNWETVKRFFITPLELDWKTVGRWAIAEGGDEAAPAMSMARLAYRVNDRDMFAYASYIFAKELIVHYVKQIGHDYYLKNTPYHNTSSYGPPPLPQEVYLTNLWGDVAGWCIDGPQYPSQWSGGQYTNRWVRFSEENVGWFYRDCLFDEAKSEMDLIVERARRNQTPYSILVHTAHIAPSVMSLRSLILNEPAADLAQLAPPSTWQSGRNYDYTAMAVSLFRTSAPIVHQQLIPPETCDFALGSERAVSGGTPHLVVYVQVPAAADFGAGKSQMAGYPLLRWYGWLSPLKNTKYASSGNLAYQRWNFGYIVPEGFSAAFNSTTNTCKRINWNTVVWVYGD